MLSRAMSSEEDDRYLQGRIPSHQESLSEYSDESNSEYDISESEIDAAIAQAFSDTDQNIDKIPDSILTEQEQCLIEENQISENQLSQQQKSMFSFRAPEKNQNCSEIPEEIPQLYKSSKVYSLNQYIPGTFRDTPVVDLQPELEKRESKSTRNTTDFDDMKPRSTVGISNIINQKEAKVKLKHTKCSSKGCQTNIKRLTKSVGCQTNEILTRPSTCLINEFTQTSLFDIDKTEGDQGKEIQNDDELGSDFSKSEVEKEIVYSRPLAKMRDYVRGRSSYNFSEREEEIVECSILLQKINDTTFEEKEKHKKSDPNEETNIKQSVLQKGATKDFPNCADIILFNKYYIFSLDGRIEKRPQMIGEIERISLPGAGRPSCDGCRLYATECSCLRAR